MACLLEATAAKPGNVHRGADFEDVTFADFAVSAVAIGPVFDDALKLRLGPLVLKAVEATRCCVASNTNLGMILLMAPLALAQRHTLLGETPWDRGVANVLAGLDAADSQAVYQAIQRANPGGLGQVTEADVAGPAPERLLDAMQLAADRDLVARQYVNGFAEVLNVVVPSLIDGFDEYWPLQQTIVRTHLRVMADFPDSLITRKCGLATAEQAAAMAQQILDQFEPDDDDYADALADFDFWLRSDGHRRNPGTTADLVTAGLFVLLRDGIIKGPIRFY